MEYIIFVYDVSNADEICKNWESILDISKLKSLNGEQGDILQIVVKQRKGIINKSSRSKIFVRFVEVLRGLQAKVRFSHPQTIQTDFGLRKGKHLFSEKLFPSIFFDEDETIINRIKGLQTREDYVEYLDYCSYFYEIKTRIYRTIVDRGRFYELRDLVSENFIVEGCVAYHLDDPDLPRNNNKNLVFSQCMKYNSVNMMAKYLESNPVKSRMKSAFPPSERMRDLLERYNIVVFRGRFSLSLWEMYQVIYSQDLDEMKRLSQDYKDWAKYVHPLRMTILRENPPENITFYKQLALDVVARPLESNIFLLL